MDDDIQRVAVDFDATLTTENVAYWADEHPEPNEKVIEWTRKQYHEGKTVFIWTARAERWRAQTERWLQEWEVPYHALVMDKLSADLYLDDKNYSPHTDSSELFDGIEDDG